MCVHFKLCNGSHWRRHAVHRKWEREKTNLNNLNVFARCAVHLYSLFQTCIAAIKKNEPTAGPVNRYKIKRINQFCKQVSNLHNYQPKQILYPKYIIFLPNDLSDHYSTSALGFGLSPPPIIQLPFLTIVSLNHL